MTLKQKVDQIRETNPQRYGILRHNFSEVQRAVTLCGRNYPEARQLYTLLDNSEISPRAFGNVLAVLAELGVIRIQTERNNRNRYDLTHCRPETLNDLEKLLNSHLESE